MALKSKFPHIRIDEQIWDDPDIVGLSPKAFRVYVFAIAWSKSQHGRTPDGVLTSFGVNRIGATPEDLQELCSKNKLKAVGQNAYEILKYCDWQVLFEEEQAQAELLSERGKLAAAARWNKEEPPLEEGFDFEQAFRDTWGMWPEPADPKYTEKSLDAKNAFRMVVYSKESYKQFSAAFQNRLDKYRKEPGARETRRKWLGAFKNFCLKWETWMPKIQLALEIAAPIKAGEVGKEAFVDEY